MVKMVPSRTAKNQPLTPKCEESSGVRLRSHPSSQYTQDEGLCTTIHPNLPVIHPTKNHRPCCDESLLPRKKAE